MEISTKPAAVWDNYLSEKGLVEIFSGWVKKLVKQKDLPYNPYPFLTHCAQRCAEKFYMFAEDDKHISEVFDFQVHNVGGGVFRTENCPPCWGLPFVLRASDGTPLLHWQHLLSKSCSEYSVKSSAGYIVYKPVAILVGPCVFSGTLYSEVSSVHIRTEWAVAGPECSKAVELFITEVVNDIQGILKDNIHILLGITVPKKHGDTWTDAFWIHQLMTEREEDFISSATAAASAGRIITAECMFELEQECRTFVRGQKQYNFNFIQATDANREGPAAAVPYLSAYEGIFPSRSAAKEYISWFSSGEFTGTEPTVAASTSSVNVRGRESIRNRRAPIGSSSASQTALSNSHAPRSAVGSGDEAASATTGPLSQGAVQIMRDHLQKEMVHYRENDEFFNMLHSCTLLLLLLSRNEESVEASLVEAARTFKCTAYELHLVMEQNKVLQDLVAFFTSETTSNVHLVQSHFLSYRRAVQVLLGGSLHARSDHIVAFGVFILDKLDSLTVSSQHSAETRTLPITSEVQKELKLINNYCGPVLLGLINDALSLCPNLQRFLPVRKGDDLPFSPVVFRHGSENMEIINQDEMFLYVETVGKSSNVPHAIAREAVLLQYMVDSRIDEVFQEFLQSLLGGSFLPPNPFPRLVSYLRRAAFRMELFRVKRGRLVSRLLSNSPQLAAPNDFIYHLPGSEAYGVLSAVSAVNAKQLSKLRSVIAPLVNKVNKTVTLSGFKALVDAAVSGFSPLFGSMLPYLHEVELQEHYFIHGPRHFRNDAIQHFSKLVCDHLSGYCERTNVLFAGVFLGASSLRNCLADLSHPAKMEAFQKQLVATVKSKEPVYMKAYVMMDWCFLPVKKAFMFHYVHGQSAGYERFFTNTPVSLYQNVFSDKEVASLYARFCGPQHRGDPCAGESLGLSLVHVDHFIERAKHDGNLLEMYRWLLARSLMSQDPSILPECWRMLHSVAGQLEYLQILGTTVQRIVLDELDHVFRPPREDDQRQSLLEQAPPCSTWEGYISKLEHVLQSATCFPPASLLRRVRDKLRKVTFVEAVSGNLRVRVSLQTLRVLEEMNQVLEPLKMAAAGDVHSCCPEIVRALRS